MRLGFGALPSTQPASASSSGGGALNPGINKAVAEDSPDEPCVAREKFGAQKAISSDMYFGRGAYDAAAVEEVQGQLKVFEGRTGIGSDEYFGREEWVEESAHDVIGRVLSNPDVQNVGDSIWSGALRLSDYLAQMSTER
ncbi:hypothetical protein B0H13DRAFT_1624120 [Mycena leptocephala]|nr:hypothetical protein B0H13DRAFT_1624120 [Mycena leptocephala]